MDLITIGQKLQSMKTNGTNYSSILLLDVFHPNDVALKQLIENSSSEIIGNDGLTGSGGHIEILQNVHFFLLPVLILVGVCGNSMALLLVTSNSTLKKLPSNSYLAFLAVSSLVFLLVLGYQWFDELAGWNHIHESSITCKLFTWLGHSCDFLSIWLIVALSIERIIVLYKFALKRKYCSTLASQRVLQLLISATVAFNAWTLFLANVTYPSDAVLREAGLQPSDRIHYSHCGVRPTDETAYGILLGVETVLSIIIPALLVTATNFCIIARLRYYRKFLPLTPIVRFQRPSIADPIKTDGSAYTLQTTNDGGYVKVKQRTIRPSDLRLTRTLLLMTSLFIILNIPTYVFRCISQFGPSAATTDEEGHESGSSSLAVDIFKLIAYLLSYFHHAGLFYVYIFHSPQMKKQLAPMAIKLLECDCFKPVPGLYLDDD